ncbi:MAG: hypothetical protein IJO43_03010 [Bacilli bacterium]|nr:hypothetical protein [Bacilli bacterium]
MDSLTEQWRLESTEMVRRAEEQFASTSPNKVFTTVDSVGAISAYVFGEDGIVSVEPCHDHQTAGKFALRLMYPEADKIKAVYAQMNNIDVSEVRTNDEHFVGFALHLFGTKDNGWDVTHASWNGTYSGYEGILYDSKQEAVNALWSDDVFACKPNYGKDTAKK